MAVVWQRTVNGPKSHALVVGVSVYSNLPPLGVSGGPRTFGLTKLRCTALAAFRFRQWLERACDDLVPPLASIRLMLSPSAEEIAAEPALSGGFALPTFSAFKQEAWAWRQDLQEDDGTSIFYFAGHGLQRFKESNLLLFNDFAQDTGGVFENATPLQNIIDGMAPSEATPTIAQTQYYFIDACRNAPDNLKDYQSILPGVVFDDLNKKDERAVAIFQATSFGYETRGRAGVSTYYCESLLEALDTASDRSEAPQPNRGRRWLVTADMVKQGINDGLVARGQPPIAPLGGAASREMLIRRLDNPPPLAVTIALAPDECIPLTTVDLTDLTTRTTQIFSSPKHAHPFVANVNMGIFLLKAATKAPFVSYNGQPYAVTFRNRLWPLELEKR